MSRDWSAPVSIKPIGVIESWYNEFEQRADYARDVKIRIREDLAPALIGLEHFSHIHVVYYQHRKFDWQKHVGWANSDEQILTMPLVGEPSCKGVYTTRSPARPSQMGSCIVELLKREGNVLTVKGLDAFDGTSVLDIKIYIPAYDSFPNAVAPLHWCQKTEMATTSKLLHWETMNVSLTLGMRAGKAALDALGLGRSDAKQTEVRGGNFFGQGVEAVTGASVINDSMEYIEDPKVVADWYVSMASAGMRVKVQIKDSLYAGADEVLGLANDELFVITVAEAVNA